MKISDDGIKLIKHFESCRLNAYDDGTGVSTIGWGHTHNVFIGQQITQDEADNLLIEDLAKFENDVNNLVTVDLTQSQFDALVSFDYNTGHLHQSTLLLDINNNDFDNASNEFMKWVHAGPNILHGLIRRRMAERALFDGHSIEEALRLGDST